MMSMVVNCSQIFGLLYDRELPSQVTPKSRTTQYTKGGFQQCQRRAPVKCLIERVAHENLRPAGRSRGGQLMSDKVRDLTVEDVARGLKEGRVVLVDVREPNETAVERFPGAVLVPLSSFDPA